MGDLPEVMKIEPAKLAELILNKRINILVLDCRPFMSFNVSHLSCACNIHCPPILKRRSGGFIALENIVPCETKRQLLQNGQYEYVIVYDSDTVNLSESSKDSNLYSVLKSLPQQVEAVNLFFLVGGYEAFSENYQGLCSSQNAPMAQLTMPCIGKPLKHSTETRPEPVEILPFLYLGDYNNASCLAGLKSHGITAIINVSISCKNNFENNFCYMNIPVEDSNCSELSPWFTKAIGFIDAINQDGGKVLVHCQAGISRSATICLAYLISTTNFSLETAYENIRSKRSVIAPNLNFMRQLQDFEKTISSNCTTSLVPSFIGMNTGLSPKHLDFPSNAFPFPFSCRNTSPCSPLVSLI